MKYKYIIFILIFITININFITCAEDSWQMYGFDSQKSNYVGGIGNMSYPIIQHSSEEDYFSSIPGPIMLIGDVCGDDFKEIVAVSEKTNSLYVFNHTLSLLWSYKSTYPQLSEEEYSQWDKASAIALGDLDGDGKNEILFSMSMDDAPETVLRAFSGEGDEIWNVTLEGLITKYGLLIEDVNSDGKNEIIVGASNIYILNGEGALLYTRYLNFDEFTGVTEIATNSNKLLVSIWHYSQEDLRYSASGEQSYGPERPLYSYLNLTLFRIDENLTLHPVLSHEMEDTAAAYSDTYSYFYTSPSFETCYFVHWTGITKIDMDDMSIKEISTWSAPVNVEGSVTDENSYWIHSKYVFSMDAKDDYPIWTVDYSRNTSDLFHSILVFDVNNDGKNEVVTTKGHDTILFFDAQTGDKILERKIFTESKLPPEILLHADTDNDRYDEIITTDPKGRIVIIDSGTPPSTEEPETSTNNLMFTGIGAGAIVISVAAVWIWRKRRDEN